MAKTTVIMTKMTPIVVRMITKELTTLELMVDEVTEPARAHIFSTLKHRHTSGAEPQNPKPGNHNQKHTTLCVRVWGIDPPFGLNLILTWLRLGALSYWRT